MHTLTPSMLDFRNITQLFLRCHWCSCQRWPSIAGFICSIAETDFSLFSAHDQNCYSELDLRFP